MKPFTTTHLGKEITLNCQHQDIWPPINAKLGITFEEQRDTELITPNKYEKLKTWERLCGILTMNEDCRNCQFAMVNGKHLIAKPSSDATPPFMRGLFSKNRGPRG